MTIPNSELLLQELLPRIEPKNQEFDKDCNESLSITTYTWTLNNLSILRCININLVSNILMVLWSHFRRKQHTWEHFSQMVLITIEKFAIDCCRHRYMSRTETFFGTELIPQYVGKFEIDSILISKVLYGLEYLQLTQSDVGNLHACQMKALRPILTLTSHFFDRCITNQRDLNIWRREPPDLCWIFPHTWLKRKLTLFGHSLRTSSDDPSDKFCLNITFSYQELNIEDRQSPYFLVVANF